MDSVRSHLVVFLVSNGAAQMPLADCVLIEGCSRCTYRQQISSLLGFISPDERWEDSEGMNALFIQLDKL